MLISSRQTKKINGDFSLRVFNEQYSYIMVLLKISHLTDKTVTDKAW